MINRVWIRIA